MLYLMRIFQKKKKKENKEGKDSSELVSKNQGLKWKDIIYKDQNENTFQNIRSKSVFLPWYYRCDLIINKF